MKAPAAELTVDGDHAEGATLEAGFAGVRVNAGASFRWQRDGEPIAGATGRRYRLTSGDVDHEVTVRATNPWFEGVSASAAHGDVVKPKSGWGAMLPSMGDSASMLALAVTAGVGLLAIDVHISRKRR